MEGFTKPQQMRVKGYEERERRSSQSILDLKEGKLYGSGKEDEGKMSISCSWN